MATDRFQQVTVHLTRHGVPTGEAFFVVLDHAKRVARRYETREAAARARVLPVELIESISSGDPDLYQHFTEGT